MEEIAEVKVILAGRSENTKRNYIAGLKRYCEFRNLQPKELIDEIENSTTKSPRERERVERGVKNFYDWLKNEKKLSVSSAHVCITAIRVFYRDNGFQLRPLRLPASRAKKVNRRKVLKAGDVKKMVDCCKNLRDRVIVLMLFQGGFDTQTLLSLDYGDVKGGLKNGEEPLAVHVVREKEGVDYATCIGHDAIEALKLYLHEREVGTRYIPAEELNSDSPLFISERVYDKRKCKRLNNIGVGILFKDLARRACVVDEEDLKRSDINIVGAHALRKSFSTICRNSGVPADLVEYMIGHRLKFDGAYYGPSDEALKEEYRKVESSLSITEASARLGDQLAVQKVEMLKEIAETFEIRFDYLRDRFVESHNLSTGSEIEKDPELLKDFRDYIRDEIDTRYERQMTQVLEEQEQRMCEKIEDSLNPAVPKVEMLKEIAEIFDIRANSLLDRFLDSHNLSNEGDIIKDPKLLKDLRAHIRKEINSGFENSMTPLLKGGGLNKYLVYKCPNCGLDLDKDWKICPKCGKKQGVTTCDNCKETLSHEWEYCPNCGAKALSSQVSTR